MVAFNPRALGSSALQFLKEKHNKDRGKKPWPKLNFMIKSQWQLNTDCDCGEVSWSAKQSMAWYINDLSEEPLRYRTKVTYAEGVKFASFFSKHFINLCTVFFLVNIDRTNWVYLWQQCITHVVCILSECVYLHGLSGKWIDLWCHFLFQMNFK